MEQLVFLILFITGLGLLVYIFVKKPQSASVSQKKEPSLDKEKIPISIDWLANNIWLRYNDALIASVLEAEIEPPLQENSSFSIKQGEGDDSSLTQKTSSTAKTPELAVPSAVVLELLTPHMQEIKNQKAKAVVEKLIELIEHKGSVPSVVLSGNDKESRAFTISVKDNLAKVTLREHTYHVVSNYIKLVQETFLDWQVYIPFAVVVALAHDIGKIPDFHHGQYNTQEHPLISEMVFADIVDKLIQDRQEVPEWIDKARKTIRDHHLPGVQDQMVVLLKKADRLSRSLELLKFLGEYTIREFTEWFRPEAFVKQLEPLINLQTGYKWSAVSNSGIVYVRPEAAYNIAEEMRVSQKIIDSLFMYSDTTQDVLHKVVDSLRGIGAVAPLVKENHYARKCKIYTATSKAVGKAYEAMLIPLRLDVISEISGVSISEIENRKSGSVEVLNIEPC